jgi:hypothetical protein
MYWLKPLALIVALAVMVHANCAVSCLHPHSGEQPLPASDQESAQDCHHGNPPDRSEGNESGDACSHSLISGNAPPMTAKIFKPVPLVLVAEVLTFTAEAGNISFVAEFRDFNSVSSAPPITVLRI